MWSDNDIDKAFQRLNPPEPEPAPFPLDAWLRLETQLDKEEVARTVRRKMWRLFALEVLVVALVGLGWLLWKPADAVPPVASKVAGASASRSDKQQLSATATPRVMKAPRLRAAASAAGVSAAESATAARATSPSAANAALSSTSTPGTAPGSYHLEAAHGKPALGLVAAIPQHHSTSKRRSAEGMGSRSALAVALVTPKSGRAGRPAAEGHPRGERSRSASHEFAQPKPWVASQASPAAAATILAMALPPRRKTQAQAHYARPVSPETTQTTAAALTPAADGNGEIALGAVDNAELTTKPVALPTAASPALPAPLGQTQETPLAAPLKEPRLYIGLVGAPDVSTVKFASVEKPLLNLGLTVEYRFANRWRVTTGLLRANKEYYARRDDYDWKNYPRAQARDITWVEGKCTVLDVPLNLRYDAVVRDNARWFGSAGLSSFFMHRENYSYDYLEGGDYKLWEMPGLVNANQHLFSVLNLSAGYERNLGSHWRLQAEPYVKVPLGGVGAGNVKLTSAGVFLGVKYGF